MPLHSELESSRRSTHALGVLPLLLALLVPAIVSGVDAPCDPALPAPRDHPFGYRLRGDRCEGVYVQDVSLATILVASLTESYENFDPQRGGDLRLEWAPPRSLETRLRAQGLERRLYYRMDAVRPAGETSYNWPVGLLAGLNIRKDALGVVAWVQLRLGGQERRVYLPLLIRHQQAPVRTGRYQVSIVPGRELKEVFLSLARVNEDGSLGHSIKSGEKLAYGYYPPDRATTITLPPLADEGIYHLEVAANLAGGGSITSAIFLYHGDR